MDEVLTRLGDSIKMFEQTIKALEVSLKKREKDILEIEIKYNVNPNKKGVQKAEEKPTGGASGGGAPGGQGVLA